jgi:hypothetical protein
VTVYKGFAQLSLLTAAELNSLVSECSLNQKLRNPELEQLKWRISIHCCMLIVIVFHSTNNDLPAFRQKSKGNPTFIFTFWIKATSVAATTTTCKCRMILRTCLDRAFALQRRENNVSILVKKPLTNNTSSKVPK